MSDQPQAGDLVVVVDPGRSVYARAGDIGRLGNAREAYRGWPDHTTVVIGGTWCLVASFRRPTTEELAAYQLSRGTT